MTVKLKRSTKCFTHGAAEAPMFRRLERDATTRRPRVTESALLAEIIKLHYEAQDYIELLNKRKIGHVG